MIYLPVGSKLKNISKKPKREDNRYKCYLTKFETSYCGLFYDDGKIKEEFCIVEENFKNKMNGFIALSLLYEQFKPKSKNGFIEIYTDCKALLNAFEKIKFSASIDFANVMTKIKEGHRTPLRIYENYTHKLSVLYLNSTDDNIKDAKRVAKEIKTIEEGKEIILLR